MIAAFSQVKSDSVLLDWAKGELLFHQEKYREAAPHFQKAASKSSGEDSRRYTDRYFLCFESLERPIEAYTTFSNKVAILPKVAGRIIQSHPEEFDRILTQHSEQFPDDLNVPYYRGQRLMHLERYADADAQFAKVVPNGRTAEYDLEEEYDRRWFTVGHRIECHLELDTWQEAFRTLPYPNYVAEWLAKKFRSDLRGSDLDLHVDAYEQEKIPGSADWVRSQRIWAQFIKENYAAVVQRVDALSSSADEPDDFSPSDWSEISHLRFSSLIRQKKFERAKELAVGEELQIILAAAERDTVRVHELMKKRFGGVLYSSFRPMDSDREVLLRCDDFAPLYALESTEAPPPVTVLIFADPIRLAESTLNHAAGVFRNEILPNQQVANSTFADRDSHFGYYTRIAIPERPMYFSVRTLQHDSNFFGPPRRLNPVGDTQLRKAAQESKGWISIQEPEAIDGDDPAVLSRATAKFVVDVAEETKPVAIYMTSTRRLALLTPELKAEIQRSGFEAALKNAAHVPLGDFNQK